MPLRNIAEAQDWYAFGVRVLFIKLREKLRQNDPFIITPHPPDPMHCCQIARNTVIALWWVELLNLDHLDNGTFRMHRKAADRSNQPLH